MCTCEKKRREQDGSKASHLSQGVTETSLTDLGKTAETVGLERRSGVLIEIL